MTRTTLLTTLTVALALGLAACGDDDDTDDAGGDALTATEYQEAGNAICESVDAEVSAVLGGGQPTVDSVQTDLAPRLGAALQTLAAGLRDLQPPAELADAHALLLSETDTAVVALEAATADRDLATQLTEQGPPMDGMVAPASELGLTACLPG